MTMADDAAEAWLAPVALAFYAANAGSGSFGEALALAQDSLGADTVFYYVARLADGARQDHHVGGIIAADRLDDYTEGWAWQNPRQRVWPELPDGAVVDFERVMPAEAFARTPAWQGFMREHVPMLHAVGLAVVPAAGLQARLGLGRTEASGPFPATTKARLAALAPHLCRAARTRLLGREERRPDDGALAADVFATLDLGVARYTTEGRFLTANAALRRLAARGDGLSIGPGGLIAPGIADAIRNPGSTGRFAISRSEGTIPYLAEAIAVPEAPRVLLVVTDPATPQVPGDAALAALFGLTGPQAALARAIAAGVSLTAYAQHAAIPMETARSRLKAVMARTGCRRQVELAALLARLA
jgi:DNA-binding CsgD family transcriptional regulator